MRMFFPSAALPFHNELQLGRFQKSSGLVIIFFAIVKNRSIWLFSPFHRDVFCHPMIPQFLSDLKSKIRSLLISNTGQRHQSVCQSLTRSQISVAVIRQEMKIIFGVWWRVSWHLRQDGCLFCRLIWIMIGLHHHLDYLLLSFNF